MPAPPPESEPAIVSATGTVMPRRRMEQLQVCVPHADVLDVGALDCTVKSHLKAEVAELGIHLFGRGQRIGNRKHLQPLAETA